MGGSNLVGNSATSSDDQHPTTNGTGNASYSIIQDDSSSSGPFEGPEKLLELWFAPSPQDVVAAPAGSPDLSNSVNSLNSDGSTAVRTEIKGVVEGEEASKRLVGLRKVKREVWEGMLDLVRCKVLSVIEGEEVDAYLLSCAHLHLHLHGLAARSEAQAGRCAQGVVDVCLAAQAHPQDLRDHDPPPRPQDAPLDRQTDLRLPRGLEVLLLSQDVHVPGEAVGTAQGLE